jgi:hypothetical protein
MSELAPQNPITPKLSNMWLCIVQDQHQSPLFCLPAELRNCIFEYSLYPYDDENNKFDAGHPRFRPYHRARQIVSTSLLFTCRRAWKEGQHLPMEQSVHRFWFRSIHSRPPSDYVGHHIKGDAGRLLGQFLNLSLTISINNRTEFDMIQHLWIDLHPTIAVILNRYRCSLRFSISRLDITFGCPGLSRVLEYVQRSSQSPVVMKLGHWTAVL